MQGDGGVGMEVKIFIKKYKQTQTKTGVVQLAVKKIQKNNIRIQQQNSNRCKKLLDLSKRAELSLPL